MDRYIVDLLLNEDNSPFNSKNFKIIEFEKNDNEKVYNLFNKVYGEKEAIDIISILFGENASLLTVCNKPAPVTHDKNSSGDINTYIIKDSSSGLFKIGKSRNPIERLKTLSIGNPNLSIIGVCNKNVELLIHKEYDSVRVDGEWFRMDNNDICHIIKKYGFICVE